jgi:putative hydrolase of the HAD superfamily
MKEVLAQLGHEVDAGDVARGMEAFKQHWRNHYETLARGERWTSEIMLDCNRVALEAIGFDRDLERLAGEITRRWATHERDGPYDDVRPSLKSLDAMRLKLGVLSQNLMTGTQLKEDLESRGIGKYFPVVVTSEDVGYDKPDQKFFERGCELAHLKNSELWYVGNRYHEDVIGARNAGITPVLVERGGHRHRSRDCLAITDLLYLPSILKDHISRGAD